MAMKIDTIITRVNIERTPATITMVSSLEPEPTVYCFITYMKYNTNTTTGSSHPSWLSGNGHSWLSGKGHIKIYDLVNITLSREMF